LYSDVSQNIQKIHTTTSMSDIILQQILDKITGLEAQFQELKSGVHKIEGDIGNMRGDIGNMQGAIGNMRGDIGNMQGAIGNMRGDIGNMNRRFDTIQGVSSHTNACAVTVDFDLAHGFIVRDTGENIYLFSAAHVVATLVGKKSKTIVITNIDESNPVSIDWTRAYCSQNYVRDGSFDVGCVLLNEESKSKVLHHFKHKPQDNGWDFKLKMLNESLSGKILTAQSSNIFMSGYVTSFGNGRASVQAHSAPGCSGTPLFLDGSLVAICHGESKHKGHSSNVPSGLSPLVFVDLLPRIVYQIPEVHFQLFESLEELPPELFENSRQTVGDVKLSEKRHVWENTFPNIDENTTLSELMEMAANAMWGGGGNEQLSSLSVDSLTVLSLIK
jgi:hypothetical protein